MKRFLKVVGILIILAIGFSIFWIHVIENPAKTRPELKADLRPDGNTYPAKLANEPLGTADYWGDGARGCESYVSWMVYSTYHDLPKSLDDVPAYKWPSVAQSSGFTVSSVAEVGSVAIAQPNQILETYTVGTLRTTVPAGPEGHAMWVKQINSNGTILVSQYNWLTKGQFSYMTIPSNGLQYIYFGGKK